MSFFKKTPEEIAANEARKLEIEKQEKDRREQEEERRRIEAELATPAGQAKAAKAAGANTFQISLPLSQTTGFKGVFFGGSTKTTKTEHSSLIDAIEAQGWRLEHANYVYQFTKAGASKSILLGSNQGFDLAYDGEIIGIYIFRIQSS
jgi:hypothetical protein